MSTEPLPPGSVRGETSTAAARRAQIEATRLLSADEYRRLVAEVTRPPPIPIPIIPKHARDMTDAEYAAVKASLRGRYR